MIQASQPQKMNELSQQKIETQQQQVQQEIEASYNRINDSIDQILLAPSNLIHAIQLQTSSFEKLQMRSTLQMPSIQISFKNELIQEIQPLIQNIVSKETHKKEQSQSNKSKEEEIQHIKVKQSQAQIINQTPLKSNLKPFTFELLKPNSIKQNNRCFAVAINQNNTIVVAGCEDQIEIYEHKQGKLNPKQQLNEHSDNVFTLNFMKQSNNFVSGSADKSIIIWQMNQNNQWSCQQKLIGHSNSIFCLLLTNNEDLIISGSTDKSIKFWDKQKEWSCQQTITDHTNNVYSLSLNEQQNKLISCSHDSTILVIEQSQNDKQWTVIQKIKVDQYGYRLCFIDDKQFTFQPKCKKQMFVYEMNGVNKQFVKTKEIKVECGNNNCDNMFPQQYLKHRCLLVNKNSSNINLIRKKQNGEFITEQSIKLDNWNNYGSLSDDGEYLITWDKQSKEIQIRKCVEK